MSYVLSLALLAAFVRWSWAQRRGVHPFDPLKMSEGWRKAHWR